MKKMKEGVYQEKKGHFERFIELKLFSLAFY